MKILNVKNQFKFARYDDSYTVFIVSSIIDTNLWLSGQGSCDMGSIPARCSKFCAAARPFCVALSPSTRFFIAAISTIGFLRQWPPRADRVVALLT